MYKICGKCKIFLEAVYMNFKYGKHQAADDEGPLYLPTWYMALLKSSKVVNLRTN